MKLNFRTILGTCAALLASTYACAGTSFSECPAIGNDVSGCELLVTVTAATGGVATAFTVSTSSPDYGPYDGSDDTLVGILNKSTSALSSITLSSSLDIFGFDGDGPCTFITCTGSTDPNGYAPAGVTYSGISIDFTSGTVNFNPHLAVNGSTWFGLEEAIKASQISSVPEPSSIALLFIGFGAMIALTVRGRRSSGSRELDGALAG